MESSQARTSTENSRAQEKIIYIEICKDCKHHRSNTWHDEAKYKKMFTELKTSIEQQVHGCQVLPKDIKTPQLGAFEIEHNDTLLFSKRISGVWPDPKSVAEKIRNYFEHLDAGKDISKFRVTKKVKKWVDKLDEQPSPQKSSPKKSPQKASPQKNPLLSSSINGIESSLTASQFIRSQRQTTYEDEDYGDSAVKQDTQEDNLAQSTNFEDNEKARETQKETIENNQKDDETKSVQDKNEEGNNGDNKDADQDKEPLKEENNNKEVNQKQNNEQNEVQEIENS